MSCAEVCHFSHRIRPKPVFQTRISVSCKRFRQDGGFMWPVPSCRTALFRRRPTNVAASGGAALTYPRRLAPLGGVTKVAGSIVAPGVLNGWIAVGRLVGKSRQSATRGMVRTATKAGSTSFFCCQGGSEWLGSSRLEPAPRSSNEIVASLAHVLCRHIKSRLIPTAFALTVCFKSRPARWPAMIAGRAARKAAGMNPVALLSDPRERYPGPPLRFTRRIRPPANTCNR